MLTNEPTRHGLLDWPTLHSQASSALDRLGAADQKDYGLIAPADAQTLDTDLSALDANKPGPVTYHLMRASLFFEHGLVDDAIAETESAVASDPDNGSLHTILGRLYAEAGRTRDAITELNQGQK